MFPLEEKLANSTCFRFQHRQHRTVLHDILSWRDHLNNKLNLNGTVQNCHCEQRRKVCLKEPTATYRVASSVLVKTVCFMRSLPCFGQLPLGDQLSLLRHGWVSLFVLGLAQEKAVFEVTDAPNSSILRQILLGPGYTEKESDQPTLDKVNRLRTCLHHLWKLDLGPKEYAYVKGAMLFNPAVQGLSASLCIEGLRHEAQRALQEVSDLLHPRDSSRFSHILLVASALRTVSHSLVTELFFSLMKLFSVCDFCQQPDMYSDSLMWSYVAIYKMLVSSVDTLPMLQLKAKLRPLQKPWLPETHVQVVNLLHAPHVTLTKRGKFKHLIAREKRASRSHR